MKPSMYQVFVVAVLVAMAGVVLWANQKPAPISERMAREVDHEERVEALIESLRLGTTTMKIAVDGSVSAIELGAFVNDRGEDVLLTWWDEDPNADLLVSVSAEGAWILVIHSDRSLGEGVIGGLWRQGVDGDYRRTTELLPDGTLRYSQKLEMDDEDLGPLSRILEAVDG